jgi:thiol-disulfide isomerase/thioredoxin
MIRPRPSFVFTAALLLSLAASRAVAVPNENEADGKQAAVTAQVAPEAKKVLDAFANYVRQLKAFKVDVLSQVKSEVLGQKVDMKLTQEVRVERPNKISITVDSDQAPSGAKVISDGNQLMVYLRPFNKYAMELAPTVLSKLLENPILLGLTSAGNAGMITAAMLSDEPADKLLETIKSVEYAGSEMLDGMKVDHLKGKGAQFDWDLYLAAGDKPLPVKFVPDLTKVLEQMMARANQKLGDKKPKIENVITFSNWDTNPKFAADAFAVIPPEGAEKVDSIVDIFGRGSAGEASAEVVLEAAAEELVGQDAPQFELATLDGGQFKLADQKDKNVVILDFWATWCGPCRRAMPVISKVARQYQDKGVVFYAVNIDEDGDTVKQFLKDEELEVPVVLDKGGEVAKKYLANAIPQTVLVGKDGRVQVVHVGLLPDLEQRLTGELDALIQGKDLASEKKTAGGKKDGENKDEAKDEKKQSN